MGRTPQQQADDFAAANARSPVVAGRAIGNGGKGGFYTLEDGTRHRLGAIAVGMVKPRWVFHDDPSIRDTPNGQ